ncbi:MAG: hypothetical protein IPN19_00975 [Elusimicrobia bacterium]|nr:hypothetical protein [Elusimicrobiota bacterium]
MFPLDIESQITKEFKNEANDARNILEEYRKQPVASLRTIRCLLALSKGDIEKNKGSYDTAKGDWRDLILWAEYDKDANRRLQQPF